MMERINRFRKGYLLIRLRGYSPERFLNLCAANRISPWGLVCRDGAYEFYLTVPEFRRIRPLVKKSHVRLLVRQKHGLPFFLYRNRKRKLYAIGVFLFFLLLFQMSCYVWDISLEGNVRYTEDGFLSYLNAAGIRCGVRKGGIDCDGLEEAIRSDFPEITWVSARILGTRLLIHVKENEVLSAVPESVPQPRNLVADSAGKIISILVREGTAAVRPGDIVEPGQLLVSGIIPITNDAEEIVSCQYVCADADIVMQTVREYEKEYPKVHRVAAKTGNTKRGIRVRAGELSLCILTPEKNPENWKYRSETRQLKLFHDFYLPVYREDIYGEEYRIYDAFYTKEEKEQLAERYVLDVLKNFLQKGIQIIENDVKILDNDTTWKIHGRAVTREPAGVGQNITETEETKQPDEYNGDNH